MTTIEVDLIANVHKVLNDELVAKYIGCTAEQVRLMRLHTLRCDACANVHPSYPQIKAFHSPCCTANRKCAGCGETMPEMTLGHEVGLICWTCYNAPGDDTVYEDDEDE